jgi:hypothetical protein
VKLYLETTVPNFLFADDAPEKQRITKLFFQWLRICPDELYSSAVVTDELSRAPAAKLRQMRKALAALPITLLDTPREAQTVAQLYLNAGIIPRQFENDALHVAVAVCHWLDVVVSWNMKHLVNVRKVEAINRVNVAHDLPSIRVHTPEEVMDL